MTSAIIKDRNASTTMLNAAVSSIIPQVVPLVGPTNGCIRRQSDPLKLPWAGIERYSNAPYGVPLSLKLMMIISSPLVLNRRRESHFTAYHVKRQCHKIQAVRNRADHLPLQTTRVARKKPQCLLDLHLLPKSRLPNLLDIPVDTDADPLLLAAKHRSDLLLPLADGNLLGLDVLLVCAHGL